MEKLNFVGNGVVRLPPGFRFHPTDEELVVQYLKRKVFSCPLPASIIPEVEVCKYDPWDLPGDSRQERYFFSTREAKYRCGNRSNRATGSGYWKATGLDKRIVASKSNQVVGLKKTLVFYTGKPPHGSRTEWIMHEYRLVGGAGAPDSILPPKKISTQSCNTSMEDWTLCRTFLKKRNSKNEDEVTQPRNDYKIQNVQVDRPPTFFDFMRKDGTVSVPLSSSSSTGSSGITEVSSGVSSDHDESSSCNSFSSPCRRGP